ncbi:MAG: amidohydrolase family protein [candidate division KSB1 bacterium]|nr:amidohydrolase family protein [candidate division KSB1 bacterium]
MMLKGLTALSWAYLLEAMRSKTALFWNLVFPMFFLFGFAIIFGGSDPRRVSYIVPGLLTITMISASFFGVSMTMVMQRETGVYRRLRITPVSAATVVLAHAATAMANLLLSIILQLVAAKVFFNIIIAGSWLDLSLAVLLSGFAFIPLGLMIGSVARDTKTAPAITNVLFFPMMFLSGAAVPFFMLPGWLQTIARFLPATYVVEILQGVMVRGESLSTLGLPVAILLLSGVLAFLVNALLFRWESTEPIRKDRLAVAVGTLTAVYAIAFLLIPQLKIAAPPDLRRAEKADRGQALLLTHCSYIDETGRLVADAQLLVRDGRIERIFRAGASVDTTGVTVHDLDGGFVIPGLIDSHVHIGGSAGGSVSMKEFSKDRVIHDLQAYLGVGVTAFVSLTDDLDDLIALREAVQRGDMRAPRPFFSGPSITAPGGHPAARFETVPGLAERLTRQVTTAAEAEQAVRELAEKRVDVIKLVLEEGNEAFRKLPRLSEEALRAAIRAAHAMGLKTTVHVQTDAHARLAIDVGADGLEHAPADLSDDTIALMARRGVTLTPTLAVFEGLKNVSAGTPISDSLVHRWVTPDILQSLQSPASWINMARQSDAFVQTMQKLFDRAVDRTAAAYRQGVRIIAGSDAGNVATFHGIGLIRELELYARAVGMSPREVFLAATRHSADRLGRSDLGRITEGAVADLVVLKANPLQDVRAYRQVAWVYFNGRRLHPEQLLSTNPGSWQPQMGL